MQIIKPRKLTKEAFKPYGDVIETQGSEFKSINSGNCHRFNDLCSIDIDPSGRVGLSVFDAKPYTSPLELKYVERHPLGSQAFMPMNSEPFLVVVADDVAGVAQAPIAFITNGQQGVSYGRNVWHGVLTPIKSQSLFTVADYIGDGDNLEEYYFNTAFSIEF